MGQMFVFHFESLSELGFVGLKDDRIGEQSTLCSHYVILSFQELFNPIIH